MQLQHLPFGYPATQEGTDLGRACIQGRTEGFARIPQAHQTRLQAVQIRPQHFVDGLRVDGVSASALRFFEPAPGMLAVVVARHPRTGARQPSRYHLDLD